ncbi:MAG: PKD domain-containing protein [Thermoleophilaceae bacterium]
MRRLRGEGGFSLPELLVAMTLMTIVLGATLAPFDSFWRTNRKAGQRDEAQDAARTALDQVARELRNVQGALSIDKATATDLVFQAVNPVGPNAGSNAKNLQRVRYCLDSSDLNDEKIWRQTQTWTTSSPPATPATTACPQAITGGGWETQRVIASKLLNRVAVSPRPITDLFTYDTGTISQISTIQLDAVVDPTPGTTPKETRLTTGTYIRNQNAAPTAGFSATASGSRVVTLDGSASTDPDGDTLSYRWCDLTSDSTCASPVASGRNVSYTAPATGNRTIRLVVSDGSLSASNDQVVNVQ